MMMLWKAWGKSDWVSQIPPAALVLGIKALEVSTGLVDFDGVLTSLLGSALV